MSDLVGNPEDRFSHDAAHLFFSFPATALALPSSYMQTINFQLSNPSFEEKGISAFIVFM